MNIYQRALDYMYANAVQEVSNRAYRQGIEITDETYKDIEDWFAKLDTLVDRAKQIKPIEVKDEIEDDVILCPVCKEELQYACDYQDVFSYCPYCGQALDRD